MIHIPEKKPKSVHVLKWEKPLTRSLKDNKAKTLFFLPLKVLFQEMFILGYCVIYLHIFLKKVLQEVVTRDWAQVSLLDCTAQGRGWGWPGEMMSLVAAPPLATSWRRGCALAVTVGGQYEEGPQAKTKRKAALGRRGLTPVNAAVAGGVVRDGGVKKRSVHCAVVGLNLSVDHCRWSTGSPAKSSCHSPGPPSRHHPLDDLENSGWLTAGSLDEWGQTVCD